MSRFAKLVNAKAARDHEKPQEPPQQQLPEESSPQQDAASSLQVETTPVVTPVNTPVVTPVATPVEITLTENQRETSRTLPQYLDATHTASEQRVYSVMYRETISRGVKERHFGPKELCEKTGIRSDRTIRTALDGLIEKLSIDIVASFHGSPLGPRYHIFEPKEIVSRRKSAGIEIDTQSKKITTPATTGVATGVATPPKNYRGTPAKSTGVTGVDFAGVSIKYRNSIRESGESAAGSSSNSSAGTDDEAYALMLSRLREGVEEVTGRESSAAEAERWAELAELLMTELKIAAGRTGSVSSVPAFLTEHLRRRLWKKEKRQLEEESRAAAANPVAEEKVDASRCPDCFGAGMYYPEGFDKGVARCAHPKLRKPEAQGGGEVEGSGGDEDLAGGGGGA